MRKTNLVSYLTFPVLTLFLSSCVSNCPTDPSKVRGYCAIAHGVGMNSTLDNHLQSRRAEVVALKQEVAEEKERLNASKQAIIKAEKKLSSVKKKTGPAAKLARQISAELSLKRKDLDRLNRDMSSLQSELETLQNQTTSKNTKLQRTIQLKSEINDLKLESEAIRKHIEYDLLIKAENEALYN